MITLYVKGLKKKTFNNCERHYIDGNREDAKVIFEYSEKPVTVITCDDWYLEEVVGWFTEAKGTIPFPDGTLLWYKIS